MGALTDVQAAVLSFAVSSKENSASVEFQKLLTDYDINIVDAVIILDQLRFKITSFMVSASHY